MTDLKSSGSARPETEKVRCLGRWKIPSSTTTDVISELSNMELKYVKALDAPKYVAFRKFNVEDPAPGTLKWFLYDEKVSSWMLAAGADINAAAARGGGGGGG